MAERTTETISTSPQETARHAAALGSRLAPGDTVLLEGEVGAGKSHFARALILSRLDMPEDVPSPTFTLVQTYPTARGEIWHADLYRLTSTLEIEELGLADAFSDAICLVEWPDRLGTVVPEDALTLALVPAETEDSRRILARWKDAKWDEKLAGWLN